MLEESEQRYSDHLPPHFHDLSLNEVKIKIKIIKIIIFQFIKQNVKIKLSHINVYEITKRSS